MAVGDIYQVVDKQDLAGQEVLNVYFYRQNVTLVPDSGAIALAEAFEGQMIPAIAAMQDDSLVHTEIIVTNLFDEADKHTLVISEPGTIVGDEFEATFTAVGYRLVQDNGEIRNGSKRYGAAPESISSDGVISDATYIALLETLAAALSGSLETGIVSAWFPVIVERILDGTEYRLPTNAGEANYGSIIDALYNNLITSQVSRKVGRGE